MQRLRPCSDIGLVVPRWSIGSVLSLLKECWEEISWSQCNEADQMNREIAHKNWNKVEHGAGSLSIKNPFSGTYLCRVLVDQEGQALSGLTCIALCKLELVQGLNDFWMQKSLIAWGRACAPRDLYDFSIISQSQTLKGICLSDLLTPCHIVTHLLALCCLGKLQLANKALASSAMLRIYTPEDFLKI